MSVVLQTVAMRERAVHGAGAVAAAAAAAHHGACWRWARRPARCCSCRWWRFTGAARRGCCSPRGKLAPGLSLTRTQLEVNYLFIVLTKFRLLSKTNTSEFTTTESQRV